MSQPLPANIQSLMLDLAVGLRSILGDRLVGLYLGGSLSLGDFCEASSDLDFLAVTEGPLSPEDLLAVGMHHGELLERHPAAILLEGDYAPQQLLVPTGTTEPVPGCERGIFLPKVGEIMLSADNIYNMRENGITIYGPAPQALLPPVSPEQVRSAVRSMLIDGGFAGGSTEDAASAILNLCRSFYALETGKPTTKSQGAAWARRHLGAEWQPVIDRAMAVRRMGGTAPSLTLLDDEVRQLDDFLRNRYL